MAFYVFELERLYNDTRRLGLSSVYSSGINT
jgi:hypothetical protein